MGQAAQRRLRYSGAQDCVHPICRRGVSQGAPLPPSLLPLPASPPPPLPPPSPPPPLPPIEPMIGLQPGAPIMYRLLLCLALAVVPAAVSLAQGPSPYAGQERRSIKAVSEKEIGDLLEGRGMGLAMAAELNSFPGPLHVLELAAELGLSDEQRDKTQALHKTMRERAQALRGRIIEAERSLDGLSPPAGSTDEPAGAGRRHCDAAGRVAGRPPRSPSDATRIAHPGAGRPLRCAARISGRSDAARRALAWPSLTEPPDEPPSHLHPLGHEQRDSVLVIVSLRLVPSQRGRSPRPTRASPRFIPW